MHLDIHLIINIRMKHLLSSHELVEYSFETIINYILKLNVKVLKNLGLTRVEASARIIYFRLGVDTFRLTN